MLCQWLCSRCGRGVNLPLLPSHIIECQIFGARSHTLFCPRSFSHRNIVLRRLHFTAAERLIWECDVTPPISASVSLRSHRISPHRFTQRRLSRFQHRRPSLPPSALSDIVECPNCATVACPPPSALGPHLCPALRTLSIVLKCVRRGNRRPSR